MHPLIGISGFHRTIGKHTVIQKGSPSTICPAHSQIKGTGTNRSEGVTFLWYPPAGTDELRSREVCPNHYVEPHPARRPSGSPDTNITRLVAAWLGAKSPLRWHRNNNATLTPTTPSNIEYAPNKRCSSIGPILMIEHYWEYRR